MTAPASSSLASRLRPGVAAAFAATVLLTLWALMTEQEATIVPAAGPSAHKPAAAAAPRDAPHASVLSRVLPEVLTVPPWDRAETNPFDPRDATVRPPPPATVASAMPAQAPAAVLAAPAAPPPPPLTYQFIGRMTTPAGQTLVMLSSGSEVIVASEGQALDNGYRIERVTAEAVQVIHAELGLRHSIPLPVPQDTSGSGLAALTLPPR